MKYIVILMLLIAIILAGCAKQVEQPIVEPVVEEIEEQVVEEIEEEPEEIIEEPKEVKVVQPKVPKLVVVRKNMREGRYDVNYITGEIKNEGTATARNVKVIVTLYDAAGELLHTTENAVTFPTLDAGEKSVFQVAYDEEDYPNIERYEVTPIYG